MAADPLDTGRVNVYEEWDVPAALEAFRGDGPGPDLTTMIVSADVSMHEITSTTPT